MLSEKTKDLYRRIGELGSTVVAYSGGVDSSLVARIAHDQLGEQAVAVTAVSPSLPTSELQAARSTARLIGIQHVTLHSREVEDARYRANSPLRCYWCKHEVNGLLVSYARRLRFAGVIDGTNLGDTQDPRPGQRAARELRVQSPLLAAGFTKSDVRELARRLGLPNWDKPAMACLASRIPYGTPVTLGVLSQIERAEAVIAELGVGQVRVRHHGQVARIEVDESQLSTVVTHRQKLVSELRALGFAYITLDLAGYRSGSLNETLKSAHEPRSLAFHPD